jgi:hypothetical protein
MDNQHKQDNSNDNNTSKETRIKSKLKVMQPEKESVTGTSQSEKLSIKNNNARLRQKEEEERRESQSNTNYSYLYPDLNDPNFNTKIASRKEFFDTRFEVDPTEDVEKQAEILCNSPFELAPNQLFVRNFLSFETPYNSLLLYHGLGTGKTCSAISVAEEMRDYMKQIGISERIIVVASPNVQMNFRLQLFDERKLKEVEPGVWNIRSCTGNKYLKEINPMNMKGLPRDRVIKQINRLINASYLFLGYIEFANFVRNVASVEEVGQENTERGKKIGRTSDNLSISKLRANFANRLIIIDEVHNIRITDDNKDKRVAKMLFQIVQHVDNIRLLLLSGTPMFNSYKEIIWLLNLMNINDRRSTIDVRDVFDKDGNLLIDIDGNQIGAELLIRKATGYISFVRGENPYTFPYRIFPSVFSHEHTFAGMKKEYPRLQINGKHIDQPIEHIDTFLVTCGEIQEVGYNYIVDHLLTKKQEKGEATSRRKGNKAKKENIADVTIVPTPSTNPETGETIMHDDFPTFENMDTVGYSIIQRPLEALNIVYPHESLIQHMKEKETGKYPIDIPMIIGKEGLKYVMKYQEKANPPMRYNFEYRPEFIKSFSTPKEGRIFASDNIGKYSCKIKSICDRIMGSTGIVLAYSQFIDGGVVPIALALEELGFTRYSSRGSNMNPSLFKTAPCEPIDAITMLPRSKHIAENPTIPFSPARYAVITGDPSISPDNNYELKALTDDDNKFGEKVKVVIISIAGAEGLDFKNIRQTHVLEPWYNMNLIEQIIGRAIRNCSHKQLPFSHRNVEIYLYGTLLQIKKEYEAVDLYLYRLSEFKSLRIGAVSRLLRETAVDCILNIQFNTLSESQLNRVVKQHLSSNKKVIDYKLGPKPYSAICDYMERCDYVCRPSLPRMLKEDDPEIRMDTFNERFITMNTDKIIQKIRDLFKERFFYKKSGSQGIIAHLNTVRTYPLAQVNMALTQLVDDTNEYITDKYGRVGHLINVGDYYMFQPAEVSDKKIGIYERSAPIPYKHESVEFPLPKQVSDDYLQIYNPEKDGSSSEVMKQPLKEVTIDVTETKNVEPRHPIIIEKAPTSRVNTVLANAEKIYNTCVTIFDTPTKTQDEWYYYSGKVIEYMSLISELGVTKTTLYGFVIANIVEHLLYNDNLLLLNYIFTKHANSKLTEFESMIMEYYNKKIFRKPLVGRRAQMAAAAATSSPDYSAEDKGILLFREGKPVPQLLIMRYGAKTTMWVEAESEDIRDFSNILSNYQQKIIKNLNKVVGFISIFKNEYLVFKVKTMDEKRNKGARCDQSGKYDVINIINKILSLNPATNIEQFKFTTMNTKERTNKELCVFEELLLRTLNEHNANGKYWFLSPADAMLCNIEKLYLEA